MFSAVVRDFACFLIVLGVERRLNEFVACVRCVRLLRVACCVLRDACFVQRFQCNTLRSPRQNYAILKKDARARARARAPLFEFLVRFPGVV